MLAKIVGYMFLLSLLAITITVAVVMFTNMQHGEQAPVEQPSFRTMLNRFVPNSMRGGQQLGRAVPGVDPPSMADRLSALASSQAIVTPTQEVIMTGTAGINGCLGGDDEALIAVKNDIGADQLDISYSFENQDVETPARIVKVASCGSNSQIRQCIPLASENHQIMLHARAYFYEKVGETSNIKEETRVYPRTIDNDTLKHSFAVNASEFIPMI